MYQVTKKTLIIILYFFFVLFLIEFFSYWGIKTLSNTIAYKHPTKSPYINKSLWIFRLVLLLFSIIQIIFVIWILMR